MSEGGEIRLNFFEGSEICFINGFVLVPDGIRLHKVNYDVGATLAANPSGKLSLRAFLASTSWDWAAGKDWRANQWAAWYLYPVRLVASGH